jgi:hypothetical protein
VERTPFRKNGADLPRCQRLESKNRWSRIRNIEVEDSREILYDISTSSHNFIANGYVTHNCDMGDLFCSDVPDEWILQVLYYTYKFPETKFLFLTKNPSRYNDIDRTYQYVPKGDGFIFTQGRLHDAPSNSILPAYSVFRSNHILGVTIETNRTWEEIGQVISPGESLFTASSPAIRIINLLNLIHMWKALPTSSDPQFFVSVEPILDFDFPRFLYDLKNINPQFGVAIGFDNYSCRLPEPTLDKTMQLIEGLEKVGIIVYMKTLREKWDI